MAGTNLEPIKPYEVLLSVLLFSIGMMLHYGADAQKFYTLKYRGSGLIKDAFFSKLRNPSYIGEDMIFLGFGIVAGLSKRLTWIPIFYTAAGLKMFSGEKVKSLSRYSDYEEWKKNTWF